MLLRWFFLIFLATHARAVEERFYIGTYTNGTASQGIYVGMIDSTTGKLGALRLAAPARPDPTFLALSPDGHVLFAALNDEIASYRLQPDGTLREISRQPSCGPNTCGMCTDRTGRFLYAASYDAGTIGSWPVSADGRLGAAVSIITVHGSGPNTGRQLSAHPHCVEVDPENRFLYACDLGADRIWIYRMNADGSLFPADPLMVTPGSGPRHLTFSPDGKLVYVVSELNVSTSVFARDARTGALRFLSSMPNIAPGWPKGTGSAEIAVDPSKKWLIVSTRLKDFLTVFRINSGFVWPPTKDLDEAALPPLYQRQVFPSPVKFPRSFAIDPTGHWIVVAGETDSRITVMRFDPANGQLSTTGQFARVDRPVCVLFAP